MSKGFKPIFTITNRITAGLTRIERARGFLETAAVGFRGGDQQARLQDEGGGLNLRQAHDSTCCIRAEATAMNSAAARKPSADIPQCKPGLRAENRAGTLNCMSFQYISALMHCWYIYCST